MSEKTCMGPEYGPEAFRNNVPPIGTWHKWLRLAEAATTLEEKVGLLHVGFQVRTDEAPYGVEYTNADRLKFYFGVADGWTSSNELREPGLLAGEDPQYHHVGWDKNRCSIKRSKSEQRQVLATKAFNMLAIEFFKSWLEGLENDLKNYCDPLDRYTLLVEGPLLPMVQNFFRVGTRHDGVRNLSWGWSAEHDRLSPQERCVRTFLLRMPEVLWRWREYEIKSYDKPETVTQKQKTNARVRAVVENAKVWIVEVLARLKELDVLAELVLNSQNKHFLDLSEACEKKLEEIALNNKLMVANGFLPDRHVATLEEACMVGSQAALFLVRYRLAAQELERLRRVQEEEAAQRNAEKAEARRLAEIEQAQRDRAEAEARLAQLLPPAT